MQRWAGALAVGAWAEGQLPEHGSPHPMVLEIQEVLEVTQRRLICNTSCGALSSVISGVFVKKESVLLHLR